MNHDIEIVALDSVNNLSTKEIFNLIVDSAKKANIDINKVIKIIISSKFVNFVTKRKPNAQ